METRRVALSIAIPLAAAALPVAPGAALALGIALAAWGPSFSPIGWARARKHVLQSSVVMLGLASDPAAIARSAVSGARLSLATVLGVFAAGAVLARALSIPRRTAALVCSGTAICGGSAIAAAGSSMEAEADEMGSAMGAIFILNAIGLYLFPWIAHLAGMRPEAFGTWCGLALHDLSSVVGAAAQGGDQALSAALSTKLARTLWIAPVSLVLGLALGRRGEGRKRPAIPWFLLGFFGLAASRWMVPSLAVAAPAASWLARRGMTAALFLVGTGLDRETIRRTGPRTLAMAVALWVATAGSTFLLTR